MFYNWLQEWKEICFFVFLFIILTFLLTANATKPFLSLLLLTQLNVGDLWLVVGSKCRYEINRCADASCRNDPYWHHSPRLSICIFLLHIYVLLVGLSMDATYLFSQSSASHANSFSVSPLSSSLSLSFHCIFKPMANLSRLSLFEINFSESHRLRFT